jgi:hypothetical protein
MSTLLDILQLCLSVIAICISIVAIIKTGKENLDEKRPSVFLDGLFVCPKEIKFYVGKDVEWHTENLEYDFDFIKKYYGRKKHIVRLKSDNNVMRMHINLTGFIKKEILERKATLVMDAFKIRFGFGFRNEKVSSLTIKGIYIVIKNEIDKRKQIPTLLIKDLKFPVVENDKLEIPIIYSSQMGNDTIINSEKLYELITHENTSLTKEENLMESNNIINFVEMGFLIQCDTTNRVSYDSSFKIFKEGEKFVSSKLEDGHLYFYENLKQSESDSNQRGSNTVLYKFYEKIK